MKKHLLVLFCFLVFVSYAQKDSRIYGCGGFSFYESQRSVHNKLTNKGYDSLIYDDFFIVDKYKFAGYLFDYACFRFVENKLFSISFHKKTNYRNEMPFNLLLTSLKGKYDMEAYVGNDNEIIYLYKYIDGIDQVMLSFLEYKDNITEGDYAYDTVLWYTCGILSERSEQIESQDL
ncbi:MAG: hypothetical protein RRY55_07810 [Bacteroidales bacterium]